MQEYDFTLKFALKNPSTDPSCYVDELYQNGCDDALIGVGKNGYISLNFIREENSAADALSSAIVNVKATIPDAVLIEATPDLVGLTDIAKVIKCSRQNVRNLMYGKDDRVPTPMHEGNPSLWHLATILEWLQQDKRYEIDESLLSIAQVNMSLNAAKDLGRANKELQEAAKNLAAIAA